MSALRSPKEILTPGEYLLRERAAEAKSEYLNGVIVAMAGVTIAHNLIQGNVARVIGNQLVGRPCIVFTSDMKVRIDRANLFRYPDVSALCGPVLFHDEVQDAYCNPTLIVEVLSRSSERSDRNEKFALYRFLDSFCEYLLVAQDRRCVEVSRRQPDGQWMTETYMDDADAIPLESIGCTLHLAEIYDKTPLPPAA